MLLFVFAWITLFPVERGVDGLPCQRVCKLQIRNRDVQRWHFLWVSCTSLGIKLTCNLVTWTVAFSQCMKRIFFNWSQLLYESHLISLLRLSLCVKFVVTWFFFVLNMSGDRPLGQWLCSCFVFMAVCVFGQATYESWKRSTLVERSRNCWATLQSWLQENFREAAKSLAPGILISSVDPFDAPNFAHHKVLNTKWVSIIYSWWYFMMSSSGHLDWLLNSGLILQGFNAKGFICIWDEFGKWNECFWMFCAQ